MDQEIVYCEQCLSEVRKPASLQSSTFPFSNMVKWWLYFLSISVIICYMLLLLNIFP